ncbi:MAG: Na+/H+ antiporter subunit E [Chloroflexota bacterium]
MMLATIVLSIPLAVIWMGVTANISFESFLVGEILGFAILLLLRSEHPTLHWRQLPDQLVAFFVYSITLARDILMCSIDVTKRVLNPNMPINPGILAVPTLDVRENDVIAAFSAHGITITPGELVLEFDGARIMFVHCLDVEASARSAPGAQAKRLVLLRRIIGAENV